MLKRILGLILSIVMLCGILPTANVFAVEEFVIENGTLTQYNGTAETVYIPDNVKTVGVKAFRNNQNVKNIFFSDKTVKIENGYGYYNYSNDNAPFGNCSNLESVTFGSGLISIGDYAFHNCPSLKNITFNDNLQIIGKHAFGKCVSIEELKFPNYVNIGENAFENCVSLKSVYFRKRPTGEATNSNKSNITVLGEYTFRDCTSLKNIYGNVSFKWSSYYNVPHLTFYDDANNYNDPDWVKKREENIKEFKKHNTGLAYAPYDYSNYVYPYTNVSSGEVSAPTAPTYTPPAPTYTPPIPQNYGVTATPTTSTLLVDGEQINFSAYNINGNNYFKLRDLAYILNGTGSQFDVGWDAYQNIITISTGTNYNMVGGEMSGNLGSQNAATSKANIVIDGQTVNLAAYNIGGNNFFMLRDIANQLGFNVDWDYNASAIIINTPNGTNQSNEYNISTSNNAVESMKELVVFDINDYDMPELVEELDDWYEDAVVNVEVASLDYQNLVLDKAGSVYIEFLDGIPGVDFDFDGYGNFIGYKPGIYIIGVTYTNFEGFGYNFNIHYNVY